VYGIVRLDRPGLPERRQGVVGSARGVERERPPQMIRRTRRRDPGCRLEFEQGGG
jgi:hypothetical protein